MSLLLTPNCSLLANFLENVLILPRGKYVFNIPSHTTDSVALKMNTQARPHDLTFFHLWVSYVLLPNIAD